MMWWSLRLSLRWFEARTELGTLSQSQIHTDLASVCRAALELLLLYLISSVTWAVVAAVALLAEAPEQRRDVFSQDAAAVLDEESDQLTHLRGERDTHTHTTWLQCELFDSWVFVFVADSSFSLWYSWTWLCLLKRFPGEDARGSAVIQQNVQLCKSNTHTHDGNQYIDWIGFDSLLHLFILQLLLLSFGATVAWITLWYQLQKLCVCVCSVIVLRNVCVRLFALMSTFQPLHKYLHSTPTKKTSNSFFSSPG